VECADIKIPEYGPNLSKVAQDQFQRHTSIRLTTKQARELVSGTNLDQTRQFLYGYHLLPHYLQCFRRVDDGNVAELQYDSSSFAPNSFFGLFQAMGPVIRGFSELQEMSICVSDCAHLYDKNFGGVIISAVTIDCNHELIPLAWGVLRNENGESVAFFLRHLLRCYPRLIRVLVTDEGKSFISAAPVVELLREMRIEMMRCGYHKMQNKKSASDS
jgi:hypothetical protein